MNDLDSVGWPLVLSAEVTVPSQTTQRPPQLALMNPTGEAFRIHEIRFTVNAGTARTTGAVVGCKLDLGSVALTRGFIPVWNFGRVISYDQDLNLQFSWRLQHPIHIPANGVLQPSFQHFGLISDSVIVRVSYFCSTLPPHSPKPRKVRLPWVTAYIGKSFSYTAADTDQSRETDLLNSFDTDLQISRLVGRVNVFSAAGGNNFSLVGSQLLLTRITLSNGDPLVRTLTPFQQIFGEDGRAWEQRNTILKPQQFFQVFVEKQLTTDVAPQALIQPYVSMVGYRELEVE